ncbi:hypothetical protein [Marimonas lutisalis]|uniref:hypothetical protein n=1 Tax=Marimonas lutisalis TaxID=2545756 RepID=UPI0010F63E59|nr:hypothetical protein [Marimonas lutisalis]
MKTLILGAVATIALAGPLMAAHANPWATDDDTVLSKEHDDNQARSIGTPGEDEMLGNMVQNVSPLAGSGAAGRGGEGDGSGGGSTGAGGGAGAGGAAGAGNGGGHGGGGNGGGQGGGGHGRN